MSSTIPNHAIVGHSQQMSLFEQPVYDSAVEKVRWVTHAPTNQLWQTGSPLEFHIHENATSYIDLKRTILHVRAAIVDDKGNSLPAGSKLKVGSDGQPIPPTGEELKGNVGPINNFLDSMFQQIDVVMNHVVVTSSENTYPYKAYIDELLTTSKEVKSTKLQSQLFIADTGYHFDDADPYVGSNIGLSKRTDYTDGSKEFDLVGNLKVDVFNLDRYLPTGIDLKIKLWQSSDAFRLMSNYDKPEIYRVKIVDAELHLCMVTPTPHCLAAHSEVLDRGKKAVFPYFKSEVKKFAISSSHWSFTQEDLFQGACPSQLIIGLVAEEATSGM